MNGLDETDRMCDDDDVVHRGPAARLESSELQLRALTFCTRRCPIYLRPTASGDSSRAAGPESRGPG